MADLDVESVMNQVRERAAEPDERDGGEEPGEYVYWRTVRLFDLFGDLMIESTTASDLYVITAELTDMWELESERRGEAAARMGSATGELLAVRSKEELDAYVVRWKGKLGIS